jgi:hypothetical protein
MNFEAKPWSDLVFVMSRTLYQITNFKVPKFQQWPVMGSMDFGYVHVGRMEEGRVWWPPMQGRHVRRMSHGERHVVCHHYSCSNTVLLL